MEKIFVSPVQVTILPIVPSPALAAVVRCRIDPGGSSPLVGRLGNNEVRDDPSAH